MFKDQSEILFALVSVSLVFLLLASLIAIIISLHKRKVERMQLEKKILSSNYEKILLQSQIEVQELTYSELGKELHDNIGQLLSTAKMLIGITQRSLGNSPDTLNTANETIGKAIYEIRALSKSLDKDWLGQFNFLENLKAEITRINTSNAINVFIKSEVPVLFNSDKQVVIFRIVQEAIQNAIKHAAPSKIEIAIEKNAEEILFMVTDNGNGFSNNEEAKGMGLTNMKHRASLLGGTIQWQSELQKGTTVTITLPVNPELL